MPAPDICVYRVPSLSSPRFPRNHARSLTAQGKQVCTGPVTALFPCSPDCLVETKASRFLPLIGYLGLICSESL